MGKRILAICLALIFAAAALAPQAVADRLYPPKIVRQVQQRCLHAGINPGPVDGSWGPKTRECVRMYQAKFNLPVTGKLNKPTIKHMHLPPPPR